MKENKVTIKDIAKLAGCSVSSVSAAFNNTVNISADTKARILEIAKLKGYQPDLRARLLRQTNSRLIGLIYYLKQDFHAILIDKLNAIAKQLNYDLITIPVLDSRTELECLDTVLRFGCEAIILIDPNIAKSKLIELNNQMPVLILGNDKYKQNLDTIDTDSYHSIYLSLKHLIDLGHHKIAYLNGGNIYNSKSRTQIYLGLMQEFSLSAYANVYSGGATDKDTYKALTHIAMTNLDATALICFNDMCAVAAYSFFLQNNLKIPNDLAIMGHDNIAISSHPSLSITSIRQDVELLAKIAIITIIDRLNTTDKLKDLITNDNYVKNIRIHKQNDMATTFLVKPSLIARKSTQLKISKP